MPSRSIGEEQRSERTPLRAHRDAAAFRSQTRTVAPYLEDAAFHWTRVAPIVLENPVRDEAESAHHPVLSGKTRTMSRSSSLGPSRAASSSRTWRSRNHQWNSMEFDLTLLIARQWRCAGAARMVRIDPQSRQGRILRLPFDRYEVRSAFDDRLRPRDFASSILPSITSGASAAKPCCHGRPRRQMVQSGRRP